MVLNIEDQPKTALDDEDVRLMLAFQNGDKASFEALMHKYFPRLLNFIFRYVNSKELAEDLTQEVFIRVYKSSKQYKPQAKFQTWLFTIAKNLCLNELRRKKTAFSIDASNPYAEGNIQRQYEDEKAVAPDKEVLKKERTKIIREAIYSLPENQRMAVLLRRYEQFSYEEIAQSMNTSVKAVKSLLNRAKENLKVKLTDLI